MLTQLTKRHATRGSRGRAGLGGRRGEAGSEVLELALSVPILLLIIFGLFALGRAWDVSQTMIRAAREGVRQAVTTNCATCGDTMYSSSEIQKDFVFPALQAAGMNTSQVEDYTQGFTWLDSSDSVCGAYISFRYPYRLDIPYLPASMSGITMKTDVEMRLENPPNDGTCP